MVLNSFSHVQCDLWEILDDSQQVCGSFRFNMVLDNSELFKELRQIVSS